MSEILLIDDDEAFRDSLAQSLFIEGFQVREYNQPYSALAHIKPMAEIVVVSDIRLPKMSGEQLRERVHEIDCDVPVILITGHGDVPMAVSNLKAGAFAFHSKPLDLGELVQDCRRAVEVRTAVVEKRKTEAETIKKDRLFDQIQGSSKLIQEVRRQLSRLAALECHVMIVGETGVGKEVASRALHSVSQRSMQPFLAVNCSLIDEPGTGQSLFGDDNQRSIFERAGKGTLFLDALEELPISVQPKLLRVLEERRFRSFDGQGYVPVDCRVICAAKPLIRERVANNSFRDDLFYRLCTEEVEIPALKDRRADCLVLFDHFTFEFSQKNHVPLTTLSSEVLSWVMSQPWPGNVRELQAAANKFAGGENIFLKDKSSSDLSLVQQVSEFERSLIASQLAACNYDIRLTAQALKTPRKTLTDKIAKYGLANRK